MKKFALISGLRAASLLSLVLVLAVQAVAASVPQASPLHLSTEFKLRTGIFALSYYGTWGDALEIFPRSADREYLKSVLKEDLNVPIQLKFLERDTVLLKSSEGQLPIDFKNMDQFEISVLKQSFVFQRGDSAEVAIGKLRAKFAARGQANLFLPEAEAFPVLKTLKVLAWLYVTATSMFATECAIRGANSVSTCIWDSPIMVKEIAMAMSLGLILLSKEQAKKYLGNKTFELEDLQCSKGADPFRAKVVDSSKVVTTVSIYYNAGQPDRVDIQGDDPKPFSVYLSPDWKAAMDRVPKGELASDPLHGPAYDVQSADLIAEAAKNLSGFCKDGDSKAAMERYRQMHNATLTTMVNPSPDQPTATTK